MTARRPCWFFLWLSAAQPQFSARICQALEAGLGHGLIALDEGAEEGDCLPAALTDRLAFHVILDDVALQDLSSITLPSSLEKIRAEVLWRDIAR